MKKIKHMILAATAAVIIAGGTAYASFPVKKDAKKEVTEQTVNTGAAAASVEKAELTKVSAAKKEVAKESAAPMDEEKMITLILWVLLWGLAAHRWYRGKPVGWNILFILTFGGCGIWAIVDLINILTDNF